MLNNEIFKQDASMDSKVSASPQEAVIPVENDNNIVQSSNNGVETPVDSLKDTDTETNLELESETKIFDQEVKRVLADPKYHAMQMPSGRVVLDLTAARNDGVQIVKIEFNRKHGKDESVTGKSLLEDGAQHLPIVVPIKVLKAAGIPVVRFEKDPNKESPINDDALAVSDGHGRINFSFGEKSWPQMDATFPVKNASGLIDSKRQFQVINENVSKWAGQDYVIPKWFDSKDFRHKVFDQIRILIDKGYKFTAACEWTIFKNGNITKKEINSVVSQDEADEFMKYMDSAKEIHQACIKKFGEGDDKLLKTKRFPEAVIEFWKSLVDRDGVKLATQTMVDFINGLSSGKAIEITNAKKDKDKDLDKDTIRKQLFKAAYNDYMKSKKV